MTVDVFIVYGAGTDRVVREKAGAATTLRGIQRIAYGGGKFPWNEHHYSFGKERKERELWYAEIEGRARDLYLVGATCKRDGTFVLFTSKGHEIPCKVRP